MSNGSADNPGGVGGAAALPFGMTAIDPVFKHPDGLHVVGRRAARGVARLRRRRHLRRTERQVPAARAQHQPAAAGHRPGEPWRQRRGAGAVQGIRRHSSVAKMPAARRTTACRSAPTAATATASSSASPIRSASPRTTRATSANVLFNSYDDSGYWGTSSFDRRHVFTFYYIYDLPFFQGQTSLTSRVLGGWQISGATFMRTGTPLWVTRGDDIAGVGDTFAQPWNQVGDPSDGANGQFSARARRIRTSGSTRRRSRRRQPARSATRRATASTTPGSISGTSRSSRTSR